MANEGTEDVVVVQGPIHDALVIIALARRQDALVVMGELYEIDSVPLAVIGVHFLTSLQVIETDAEVFAASHEVLAIVADINGIDLLFLKKMMGKETRQIFCLRELLTKFLKTRAGLRDSITWSVRVTALCPCGC